MNVSELISFLQTQPQHLTVVYRIHSEQCVLEKDEIEIRDLCEPRPDGWVHDKRPDKATQFFLVLPGN